MTKATNEVGAASAAPSVDDIIDFDLSGSDISADFDEFNDADDVTSWDGKSTTLTLGYPLVRNHEILGRGDKVTFRASRDSKGRWHGPEGIHVTDLQRNGTFAGSSQFEARRERQAAVNVMRGVTDANLPELRPLTHAAQVKRQPWAKELIARSDSSEVAQARKDGAEVMDRLIAAIEGQRGEISRDYPGGEGPGSARNADGTSLNT